MRLGSECCDRIASDRQQLIATKPTIVSRDKFTIANKVHLMRTPILLVIVNYLNRCSLVLDLPLRGWSKEKRNLDFANVSPRYASFLSGFTG